MCLYLMAFYTRPLGVDIVPFLPRAVLDLISQDKSSLMFHLVFETIPALTWPQIVGALTFPICAGKQIINVVQFWKAAKTLADSDLAERRKNRL